MSEKCTVCLAFNLNNIVNFKTYRSKKNLDKTEDKTFLPE